MNGLAKGFAISVSRDFCTSVPVGDGSWMDVVVGVGVDSVVASGDEARSMAWMSCCTEDLIVGSAS